MKTQLLILTSVLALFIFSVGGVFKDLNQVKSNIQIVLEKGK